MLQELLDGTPQKKIALSSSYELLLLDAADQDILRVPPGFVFNGKWNALNLVCSEAILENKCAYFPNFLSTGVSGPFFGSLLH